MASSYMLSDRIKGYEVKVKRGRKIVKRKRFTDELEALFFLSTMEEAYWQTCTFEFNTIYRDMM